MVTAVKPIAAAGALVTTAVAMGLPALAALTLLLLFVTGAACWVVANQARTKNVVAIIAASRGHQETGTPK